MHFPCAGRLIVVSLRQVGDDDDGRVCGGRVPFGKSSRYLAGEPASDGSRRRRCAPLIYLPLRFSFGQRRADVLVKRLDVHPRACNT